MNLAEPGRAPESVYDEMPYQGTAIPLTSPIHLDLCSTWHKSIASPLRQFHVTELGCGDGANIIALAFHHPESTFVGIDSSSAQLYFAGKAASAVSLTNIRFIRGNISDLNANSFLSSDYILCHGLYSWVAEETRHAILHFCRQNLTPNGLAYISYNAQPGWATRNLVRETLLRSPIVRNAQLHQKAQKAIQVATTLLEDLPSRDYAHAVMLAGELERVRNGKPDYVFHEYLAEVNDGFWLGEFVERARSHNLEYVCDAQFCRWEGRVSEELRARVAQRTADQVEQEELADLLGDRYFRASILCRSGTDKSISTSRDELWDQVHIATSLGAMSDQFDLAEGIVERFSGTGEVEITLRSGITKAAIVSLCELWPRGASLQQIYERSRNLLMKHGVSIREGSKSHLRADLTTLFEAGQIDLRLHEPCYSSTIPEFPEAHALARFEAAHRNALSTPYHLPIPFEPAAMAFIQQLDGRRSTADLSRDFGDSLTKETLSVMARWGLFV